MKAANKYFKMSKLKYFGTTVTNQNWIQEEINSRLNSENASYHLVDIFSFSRLA